MLFENDFEDRNFGQFRILGGIKIYQQPVHKITTFHSHFQPESKQVGRNSEFQQAISSRSEKNSQPTKINGTLLLIMDFIPNEKH